MTNLGFQDQVDADRDLQQASGEKSPKYHRPLTGAKGIGRFAVRYSVITLCWTRRIRQVLQMHDKTHGAVRLARVRFRRGHRRRLGRIFVGQDARTTQPAPRSRSPSYARRRISRRKRNFGTRFYGLCSPLQALESGPFQKSQSGDGNDPGFRVVLPGETGEQDIDLAGMCISNSWGRLVVELKDKFSNSVCGCLAWMNLNCSKWACQQHHLEGIIRGHQIFPSSQGSFKQKGFNGQQHGNGCVITCGVKVVDHGSTYVHTVLQ